mmetsp:Transcript_8191/g.12336  ORF Transcript_8191/g.12336 Transcript_8191/m.12336 type:complete len:470 (+) Transcript_8191:66-1475(+)
MPWHGSDPLERHPIKQSRAYFTISANLLVLLIGSGTVYGYNAFRPVLIQDGAYADLCPKGETDCNEQRLGLNFAETMCFFLIDIVALPCGIMVDQFGLKTISSWLAVFYALGFIVLLLASQTKNGILYVTALLLLAGAPCCSYLTGLASGKMLRDASNTHFVSALVSLCYEVSPMFMYLLQVAVPRYVSFQFAIMIFGSVTVSLAVATAVSHMSAEEAVAIDKFHGFVTEAETTSKGEKTKESNWSIWTCCADISDHLVHPRYLLHLLFMTVVNTKNQFYVATFADQIDYFASPEESLSVNRMFDIGFFVSALVVTPIVIIFLGMFRDRFDVVFFFLWFMTMIHATVNTFGKTSKTCQLIAMMVFFLLKPLKWAASAEFLHRPPYQLSMYGRLYGIVNISCGAGALTIYPLTRMSYDYFDGCFFNANLILTILEGCVFVFPLYLYYEYKRTTSYSKPLKPVNESVVMYT